LFALSFEYLAGGGRESVKSIIEKPMLCNGPGEVLARLPAANWRHHRVAEVVLALPVALDVVPRKQALIRPAFPAA
jgi:hypothetical protein